MIRPKGNNADEWQLFLVEHSDSSAYCAVQIAEAIDDAIEEAIDRMGWVEINAFRTELHKGQDIYEDAGGYFIRAIKALFGLGYRHRDPIVTYQDAARALMREPRAAVEGLAGMLRRNGK
jgi:hypothetical protein